MKAKATLSVEAQALLALGEARAGEVYILRLYVTGASPRSLRAISNIRRICEEHLEGRYELEVVDICENPALAKDEQILASPTLIRTRPLPPRRFIGDLSQSERIMLELGVEAAAAKTVVKKPVSPT
jgi:circadian clock protein KaiB